MCYLVAHKNLLRRPCCAFYTMFGLALVTSFCTVLFVTYEFDDWDGAYSAFGQNLLMSVLFITMLYARRSLRGQSVPIAISKMLGTALASLAFYLYSPLSQGSILLPFLYVAILVFDLIYVVMVWVWRVAGAGRKEEYES
jgi:peptidoglycan/LPS O-acetylase OafA/YrhL